jgi:hypothetical protein
MKVMKKLTVILVTMALLGLAGGAMAQSFADHVANVTVNGFNIIRVNTTAAIALTISAPATPGSNVSDATEATHYLQYTAIKTGSTNFKITGIINSGTMPTGSSLYVAAGAPGAGGAGSKGTSAGEKLLSGTAADLITTIGSCYTNTGATDGSLLSYRMTVDWATIQSGTAAITVRYTITT